MLSTSSRCLGAKIGNYCPFPCFCPKVLFFYFCQFAFGFYLDYLVMILHPRHTSFGGCSSFVWVVLPCFFIFSKINLSVPSGRFKPWKYSHILVIIHDLISQLFDLHGLLYSWGNRKSVAPDYSPNKYSYIQLLVVGRSKDNSKIKKIYFYFKMYFCLEIWPLVQRSS